MTDHDIDRTLADWFEADALAPGRPMASTGPRGGSPAQAPTGMARRSRQPLGLGARHARVGVGVRALPGWVRWSTALIVDAAPRGPPGRGAPRRSPAARSRRRCRPRASASLAYALDGDIFVADWDGQNPVRIADGLPGGKSGLRLGRLLGRGPDVVA